MRYVQYIVQEKIYYRINQIKNFQSNRVELIYKQTEAQELLAQKMEDKIKQV